MITTDTKILGIIGDPISHSLSPMIQNAAFLAAELNMVYLPFHVNKEGLSDAIRAVRALGMLGLNVTIPYKELVSDFLDEVTEEAQAIGAVNTITNNNGTLTGHNTDGQGYIKSLATEAGFDCADKKIVILGAGGAARGILYAMLKKGPASVVIANRNPERGVKLKEDFKRISPSTELSAIPFEKKPLMVHIKDADLVVNTTSLGMSGKPTMKTGALSLELLKSGSLVSDIVYRPYDTALLKAARSAGAETHRGLGMLIYQGAIAFELWTGCEPNIETMFEAALVALEIR